MVLKYNMSIDVETVKENLKRLTNQVYKLLPSREEQIDWQNPLDTIIVEFAGMSHILIEQQELLFSLLCKLEGLFILTRNEDFHIFRKTIFECLGIINKIKESLC